MFLVVLSLLATTSGTGWVSESWASAFSSAPVSFSRSSRPMIEVGRRSLFRAIPASRRGRKSGDSVLDSVVSWLDDAFAAVVDGVGLNGEGSRAEDRLAWQPFPQDGWDPRPGGFNLALGESPFSFYGEAGRFHRDVMDRVYYVNYAGQIGFAADLAKEDPNKKLIIRFSPLFAEIAYIDVAELDVDYRSVRFPNARILGASLEVMAERRFGAVFPGIHAAVKAGGRFGGGGIAASHLAHFSMIYARIPLVTQSNPRTPGEADLDLKFFLAHRDRGTGLGDLYSWEMREAGAIEDGQFTAEYPALSFRTSLEAGVILDWKL